MSSELEEDSLECDRLDDELELKAFFHSGMQKRPTSRPPYIMKMTVMKLNGSETSEYRFMSAIAPPHAMEAMRPQLRRLSTPRPLAIKPMQAKIITIPMGAGIPPLLMDIYDMSDPIAPTAMFRMPIPVIHSFRCMFIQESLRRPEIRLTAEKNRPNLRVRSCDPMRFAVSDKNMTISKKRPPQTAEIVHGEFPQPLRSATLVQAENSREL